MLSPIRKHAFEHLPHLPAGRHIFPAWFSGFPCLREGRFSESFKRVQRIQDGPLRTYTQGVQYTSKGGAFPSLV